MTIFVNIMLILLAFAIVCLMGFKYIYPLFFINKWDRKYAKIIVQRKKPFNKIIALRHLSELKMMKNFLL